MSVSIIKNPVFLAVLATCVVFVITYYYYNYYCRNAKKSDKQNDKKSNKQSESNGESKNAKDIKKKDGIEINEIMILSSIIAGLVTWYIASSYFGNDKTLGQLEGLSDPTDQAGIVGRTQTGGANAGFNQKNSGLNMDRSKMQKIPHLDSDDVTRSYNLIGSGVNIPRSDLKIPSVLIDYR